MPSFSGSAYFHETAVLLPVASSPASYLPPAAHSSSYSTIVPIPVALSSRTALCLLQRFLVREPSHVSPAALPLVMLPTISDHLRPPQRAPTSLPTIGWPLISTTHASTCARFYLPVHPCAGTSGCVQLPSATALDQQPSPVHFW